jgi:hypothetical protein
MNEQEIVKLFASLGFKKTEYNINRYTEVRDFGFFAIFENEHHAIQFISRNDEVLVSLVKYDISTWKNHVDLSGDVLLAVAKVVEEIKEEYKGEIK